MKQHARTGISILLLAFSVAGLYNVMADNAEVEKLALETVCQKAGAACKAQKTMMERNPLAQTFEFATGGKTVRVRCARAFVLVGDYACATP